MAELSFCVTLMTHLLRFPGYKAPMHQYNLTPLSTPRTSLLREKTIIECSSFLLDQRGERNASGVKSTVCVAVVHVHTHGLFVTLK